MTYDEMMKKQAEGMQNVYTQRNYTLREVEEMQERRDAYYREGMLIGLCVAALSGASFGFFAGWFLRDWLL